MEAWRIKQYIKMSWWIVLVIVGFCILNFGSLEGKKQMEKFINDYWWIILIIIVILYSLDFIGLGNKKYIFKTGPYYTYLYKKKEDYDKFLKLTKIFQKYNFMPKVVFNYGLIVVVEDVGVPLSIYTLNHNTLKSFQQKINFIRDTFQKHNFIHNDITDHNIMVKNDNLYIIDTDESVLKENSKEYSQELSKGLSQGYKCCIVLPEAKNDNIIDYMKDNPCITCGESRFVRFKIFLITIYEYIKKITLILCILVVLRVKKFI